MSSLIVQVVRIPDLERHPNADTLLIARVKGWQCLVKEGQFQPGDLAVYVPVDSVLPPELIEKHGLTYLSKGERVKAVKLRQVLSEGLLLSLPEGVNWREGQEVGNLLGITKWEPPVRQQQANFGVSKSHLRPNPYFRRYCDPENIKNFPGVFAEGEQVIITEKIHGTNFRCGWVPRARRAWWERFLPARVKAWLGIDEWEFCVGSRNVHLVGANCKTVHQSMDGNPYWDIANRGKFRERIPKGYIIFGEIFGPGIQDLTYGLPHTTAMFFDAMKNGVYVDQGKVRELFGAWNGLFSVPILYRGPYRNGIEAELYSQPSRAAYDLAGVKDHLMEGVVIVSAQEQIDNRVGRKILKAINPDYLLRKSGTEFH